jgi:hypothetical protein
MSTPLQRGKRNENCTEEATTNTQEEGYYGHKYTGEDNRVICITPQKTQQPQPTTTGSLSSAAVLLLLVESPFGSPDEGNTKDETSSWDFLLIRRLV